MPFRVLTCSTFCGSKVVISNECERSFWMVTTTYKEDPMIKKELLDILACPKCKKAVKLNKDENGLVCDKCQLIYEIRDDIPIMLIDEARKID